MVQTNTILVANGKEDGCNDKIQANRAALAVNADGSASLVVAYGADHPQDSAEGPTLKEFGDILAAGGSISAVNLDGGPSVQMVLRTQDGETQNVIHRDSASTSAMPQLFIVK